MRRLFLCLFVAFPLLAQNPTPIPAVAPAGWSAGDAQGSQVFRPPDLAPGATFAIIVPPSVAGAENLDQILDEGKRVISAGSGFQAVPQALTGRSQGGWDFKYVLGDFQRGKQKFVGIVAAVHSADQVGYILAVADSAGTLQKYASQFTTFLNGLGVVAAPAPPNHAPADTQGLFGVYFGLRRGLSATAAGNAYGDSGSLYFFLTDGTFRVGLPLRGFPSDLPFDRTAVPSRWGSWTQTGGEIVARRDREITKFLSAGANTLIDSDRNREWHKLSPFPDGLLLDGSFVRADGERRPESPRLVLMKEGRFQTRGPFCQMIGSLSNVVEPHGYRGTNVPYGGTDPIWRPGEGTYEINAFSFTLHYRDGRVLQFAAYLPPGQDPQTPGLIVLGDSYTLSRE
jgi:hypothetical protein